MISDFDIERHTESIWDAFRRLSDTRKGLSVSEYTLLRQQALQELEAGVDVGFDEREEDAYTEAARRLSVPQYTYYPQPMPAPVPIQPSQSVQNPVPQPVPQSVQPKPVQQMQEQMNRGMEEQEDISETGFDLLRNLSDPWNN